MKSCFCQLETVTAFIAGKSFENGTTNLREGCHLHTLHTSFFVHSLFLIDCI